MPLSPPTAVANAIGVYPYSAIALRMFGYPNDGDTGTLELWGYMDPATKSGTGPPQSLWKGQILLGAYTIAGGKVPLYDDQWNGSLTWREVDTYDIGGVAGGHNAANAVVISAANSALLILPTLGYGFLRMHVSDIGAGGKITNLGAIYREVSMGGVV